MSETITIGMVQDQIRGLQRTQAEECWIRKDIFFHILGEEAKDYIANTISLSETPMKPKNLVQAMKQRKNPPVSRRDLVCIDRAPALEAILKAVAKKSSSPRKKGAKA